MRVPFNSIFRRPPRGPFRATMTSPPPHPRVTRRSIQAPAHPISEYPGNLAKYTPNTPTATGQHPRHPVNQQAQSRAETSSSSQFHTTCRSSSKRHGVVDQAGQHHFARRPAVRPQNLGHSGQRMRVSPPRSAPPSAGARHGPLAHCKLPGVEPFNCCPP